MIYLCECASSFIWDNASAPLTNCLVRCHPHCASLENVTVYSDTHIYIIIHQLVTFIKFIAALTIGNERVQHFRRTRTNDC